MKGSTGFRSGLGTGMLLGIGFFVLVALGIGLLVLGFALGRSAGQPVATRPTMPTQEASQLPTATVVIVPTLTPLPTATPLPPTPIPPTETPQPMAVVGTQGANIRSGPGTNFSIVGRTDPGTQLPIIGRYGDWWQVLYNGTPAWIANIVVTTSNVESVAEVVPPPSPIPPPPTAIPTATPIPATATPASVRGLVPVSYVVEGAPGPFSVAQASNTGPGGGIWFNFAIRNQSATQVDYMRLGTFVDETNDFESGDGIRGHASYSNWRLAPGEYLQHRDHVHFSTPGTYHLWLAVQFSDGQFVKLLGPVTITIQ